MDASTPRPIPAKTLQWLLDESASWEARQILSPDARQRLLGSYEAAPPHAHGLLALLLLAAVMTGAGVLLLVGYNWDRIAAAGKIAILSGSVAIAFGGSAVSAARGRQTAAHALASLGTLLFGTAIWLVAQVLHMRVEFSDGLLWWAAGALCCAWLVRSVPIGIGAAALTIGWVLATGVDFGAPPTLLFLGVAPLAIGVAYRLDSALMLRLLLVSLALWMALLTPRGFISADVTALAIAGCAIHAVGAAGRDSRMSRVWRTTALAIVLVSSALLMTKGANTSFPHDGLPWNAQIPIAAAVLLTIALTVRGRPGAPGVAIAGFAAAAFLRLTANGVPGLHDGMAAHGATLLFSGVTLWLGVTLILSGARADRLLDLVFGVLFGLAFVLVRWLSLIDNMLSSGLLLIATAAGLVLVARLWQQRLRPARLAGGSAA